jgi:hypothetical protein
MKSDRHQWLKSVHDSCKTETKKSWKYIPALEGRKILSFNLNLMTSLLQNQKILLFLFLIINIPASYLGGTGFRS